MAIFNCFGFRTKRYQTGSVDGNLTIQENLYSDNGSSVRKFSWDEIENLTRNFSNVIGSGGFSTVYLARFPSGFGAIKVINGSELLNRIFKQELDILIQLNHNNIIKLIGYCDEKEQGALVFEYVSNGTLQEKLHGHGGNKKSSPVLPWKNRMAIAFQVAQALEYLHEKCDVQIVHGDIKASNVLIDKQLNCKLCDFGFAKMGFSSTVLQSRMEKKQMMRMMGSPGYTDPCYIRTGIASKKNDVYGFGVMLLELVTGKEAFCSDKCQMLTALMRERINGGDLESIDVKTMVDPRLGWEWDCDLKEAKAILSLSALCLRQSPTLRPSASGILETMKSNINSISFLFSPSKTSKI